MADRIMETDEEYLDRMDGTPEGNFARAGGYNRMANAAVADYNSRPSPEDWDGALRHQEEEQRVRMEQERNAALAQQISANRGVYDGYAQMGNTVAARQAQFMGNANAHLASSLRLAAENGGRLPQYAWQGLGGALGLDEKDAAIVGGGFDKKGGFTLAVARKNPQTGQVEQTPMSFTPQQQYALMLSTPGIFSRQEVEGMRGQLIDNFHMHPDQVPQVPQGWGETGDVGVGNRTATGGTSVNPNWLFGPQRRSSISAFGANGRGGFTQYESNEDTGYQLQQRDSGTRAPEPELSERERIARMKEQGLNDREELKERGRLDRAVMSEEGRLARGEGSGRGGLTFEQRMQLEEQKNKRLETQEQGRSSRAKQGDDMSKARLVATVSRNWYDLKNSLGLSDEQAEGLQDWMAKSFTQAFAPSRGGQATPASGGTPPPGKTEVKQGDNGGGQQFRELSRDEYSALSPEEKQKYREAWKNWKSK